MRVTADNVSKIIQEFNRFNQAAQASCPDFLLNLTIGLENEGISSNAGDNLDNHEISFLLALEQKRAEAAAEEREMLAERWRAVEAKRLEKHKAEKGLRYALTR